MSRIAIVIYALICIAIVLGILMAVWWYISNTHLQERAPDPIYKDDVPEEYLPQYTLDVLTNGEFADTPEEQQEIFNTLDALDGKEEGSNQVENQERRTPHLPAGSQTWQPDAEAQARMEALEALSAGAESQ